MATLAPMTLASIRTVTAAEGIALSARGFASMYMPNFRSGMAARFDSPKDAAHSPRDSLRRVPTTYAAGEWSATPLTEEEAQAEFRDTVHNALGKTCEGKHGAPGERVSAERSFRMSQGVMDGFAESKR